MSNTQFKRFPPSRELVIASTSTVYGGEYLDYLTEEMAALFADAEEVIFIPYARPGGISHDEYTEKAAKAFSKIGKKLVGLHTFDNPVEALKNAKGAFTISSGVRSNVTLESAQLVKKILEEYPTTFSDKDLETTKGFLIKSNARAFETSGAKLRMLSNIANYGMKADYISDREETVNNMTKERISELANTYVNPNKMIWLIVGDAETQLNRMKELGYGEPVLLNERQKKIKN